MKSYLLWWLGVLLTVFFQVPAATGSPAPKAGDQLIPIVLEIPADAKHRTYLGLAEADPSTQRQGALDATSIKGRLLVIEIFSMYCPHCQREAPAVNRLYDSIEASLKMRGQVKMIGIGVGNSAFEVDHFRKHYQIAFPLFPDENFKVHKDLGDVRTPFFIIVGLDPDNRGRVLWTGAGKLGPQEDFVARLEKLLEQR